MTDTPAVTQRIIPGAPPPAPLSKSQKKRRKGGKKTDEAGIDSPVATNGGGSIIGPDSEHPDVEEKVPEPAAPLESIGTRTPAVVDEDDGLKYSPIVDLVNKRLKNTNKKITKITGYATSEVEKLNDDQKRNIKNLPSLEAVQRELQEVKKAIEVHEAELVHELIAKQEEVNKTSHTRTAEAVASAQAALADKFTAVLDLLRVSNSSGSNTVLPIAHVLLSDDHETRKTVLSGLLSEQGEYEGVPYSQVVKEVQAALHPSASELEPEDNDEHDARSGVAIAGRPSATSSGGFHFIQVSELEQPAEEEPAPATEDEIPNGHVEHEETAPEAPQSSTIDWAADDDHDLPPIAGLQAEFGGSGSATPAADAPSTPAEHEYHEDHEDYAPGTPRTANVDVDEDGFTQARSGRGRSRGGRGGDRGGDRGGRGFRGDGRGFRGHRGHHRGGERGGERGERGGFRGGDRGSYRGGERGGRGYRGRSDGEHRGRGGFRGGRGDRGGPRASPTPA